MFWILYTFTQKKTIKKKLILVEKRWLLHYKRLKFDLLNEISKVWKQQFLRWSETRI